MDTRMNQPRLAVLVGVLALIAAGFAASIGVVRSDRAGAVPAAVPQVNKEVFCVPVSYRLTRGIQIRCGQVAEGGYRYFANQPADAVYGERVFTMVTTALEQQRPLVIWYRLPLIDTNERNQDCPQPHRDDCMLIDGIGLYKRT